jgi:hypothetical protein
VSAKRKPSRRDAIRWVKAQRAWSVKAAAMRGQTGTGTGHDRTVQYWDHIIATMEATP